VPRFVIERDFGLVGEDDMQEVADANLTGEASAPDQNAS
jgi:hypothetical protein